MTLCANLGAIVRHLVAQIAIGFACAGLAQAQAPLPASPASPASAAPQSVAHGLFSDVQIFRPAGPAQQFVLLVSAGAAPSALERQMVRSMVASGAMVAFVPLAPFYRRLEAQDGKCTYAAGAFENLARHLEAYEQLPGYLLPIVTGTGAGAAFAYALVAQAPAGTFASAISLGFCPQLALKTPLCAGNGLRAQTAARGGGFELVPPDAALPVPWTALASGADAACTPAAAQAFVQRVPQASWTAARPAASASAAAGETLAAFEAAYAKLAVRQAVLGAPPAQLADLPIVELPAAGSGRRFAVLLSGDGGWASIDKGIANALVAQGVSVAGFDSLRYFWSARTPDGLAADLDRVIRYYAARWKRSEVLLIGYSQGADVLPFAINRLPAATRASVRLTVLLGLGQQASFEFHLANWIGPSGERPIAPEASKLAAATTLCVYGTEERDSLCPSLAPAHVRAMPLAGGHHFGGDYDALAARLLDAMPR